MATTARPLSLLDAPAPSNAPPDQQTLRAWATDLSRHHFGVPFPGQVLWAPRLRYRAGDYAPARQTIRLSLPYFQRYGADETRRILLHELCHWWLLSQGVRHREDAAAFQRLLRQHGAPAKGLPMPRARSRKVYMYACPVCGARYPYRRRVNYACGHCCRRWSGGRYDARFRLTLMQPDGAGR